MQELTLCFKTCFGINIEHSLTLKSEFPDEAEPWQTGTNKEKKEKMILVRSPR